MRVFFFFLASPPGLYIEEKGVVDDIGPDFNIFVRSVVVSWAGFVLQVLVDRDSH